MMKEPLETVTGAGQRLGEYIRDQRRGSQISLRQLSTLAGVSNPYLSQIERGLRKPSAEILQQIAKGLRISAEALYLQAGILDERQGGDVSDAVLADEGLTERQKQVLLEIYDSFRKENTAATVRMQAAAAPEPAAATDPDAPAAPEPGRKQTARKRTARSTSASTPPTSTQPTSTQPTTPEEALP